jgi:ABC-2 type transport system permease protein
MNFQAVRSIYSFEMARFFRTLSQSLISPVLSTSLYFVVFGAAIGSRIDEVEGVSYGAFIVPGLIMLSVMTQAFPTPLSASIFPNSSARSTSCSLHRLIFVEIVLGYVGAAATKALFIGT